jgi:hypothetical protein
MQWTDEGIVLGIRASKRKFAAMGMKQTLAVVNEMEAGGIIGRYAISGAVAAYNYIEAAVTDDLDVLVAFEDIGKPRQTGLITLAPIYSYLKARGYEGSAWLA